MQYPMLGTVNDNSFLKWLGLAFQNTRSMRRLTSAETGKNTGFLSMDIPISYKLC